MHPISSNPSLGARPYSLPYSWHHPRQRRTFMGGTDASEIGTRQVDISWKKSEKITIEAHDSYRYPTFYRSLQIPFVLVINPFLAGKITLSQKIVPLNQSIDVSWLGQKKWTPSFRSKAFKRRAGPPWMWMSDVVDWLAPGCAPLTHNGPCWGQAPRVS